MQNYSCQRLFFWYFILLRKMANKPAWLPADAIWSHPSKKNSSESGKAMTSQQFLENARKVLRAAYVHGGIDPDSHIKADQCLTKSMKKVEPYRLPLNSKFAQTSSAKNVSGRPPQPKEMSFIPVNDSCNVAIQPPTNGLHMHELWANNS